VSGLSALAATNGGARALSPEFAAARSLDAATKNGSKLNNGLSPRRIGVPIRSQDSGRGTAAASTDIDMTRHVILRLRRVCVVLAFAGLVSSAAVFAQSGDSKVPDQGKPPGDPAKETQQKIDEIAEAARVLSGPAGNPECVWLGRRVVSLLWRDDLDTAFRHLDLYDRFGCPSAHIQATFRCLIRQGHIDPKVPESLNSRAHACWINPALEPPPPVAAKAPSAEKAPPTK